MRLLVLILAPTQDSYNQDRTFTMKQTSLEALNVFLSLNVDVQLISALM